MILIQLSFNNKYGELWITFEKEYDMPYLLPLGAKFEIPNLKSWNNFGPSSIIGIVYGYCYRDGDSKFITKIKERDTFDFSLKYRKESLLKNGWNIIFQDDNLILKDKCE